MFRRCRWGVALLASANAFSAGAADVQTNADIFTALTFTNNINLEERGLEVDETVWQLNPSIGVTVDGKNVDLSLNYTLQSLLFVRDDDLNRINNFLDASLEAQVVPEFLFFNSNAQITQNIVDAQNASGFSSISGGDNLAETITAEVSPFIRRKLGSFTELRAGLNAGLIEYDRPELFDTTQIGSFVSINNVEGAGPFNWVLDYNSRTVEYDIGQEIKLSRIGAEVGYRLSPRMELVVSGGDDSNDFDGLPGNSVAEGSFWDVGLRGSLSNTTTYEISVGEQFFGDSYGFSLVRTSRDLTTQIGYQEEATTSGAQQLNFDNALSSLSQFDPGLVNTDISGLDLPQVNTDLYVRKRFDAGATYSRSKSTWALRGYYEDRTFIRTLDPGSKENAMGASIDWTWDVDSTLAISTGFDFRRLDSRNGFNQPEEYRFSVSATRDFFSSTYVRFDVYTDQRSATNEQAEFEDIGATLGIGRRF